MGGVPQKEYTDQAEGANNTYIESMLKTPFSYEVPLNVKTPHGDEPCLWPVTPYQISLANNSGFDVKATVCVDGVHVTSKIMKSGSRTVVKGFHDGDAIKEFLFSMPRFAESEDDRIQKHRYTTIGEISCSMQRVTFSHFVVKKSGGGPARSSDFKQCNKKDAKMITTEMVATTRMGRAVETKPYSAPGRDQQKPIWSNGEVLEVLTLRYRMGHTLQALKVKPEDAPSKPAPPVYYVD